MAAVTLGVQTGSTAAASTYETGTFTPAANDLLIALSATRGTVAAGAYTSSDAGKTYVKVTHADWGADARRGYAFAAEQLADADLQTGTMDVTGDAASGCAQVILRVSGMTKTGLTAIRQFKILETQEAGTPAITFDAACLTDNPTIFAIVKALNTTVTAPTGWTNTGDVGFNTPDTRCVVATRDSGFTGTTITAGGASDGTFAVIGIELDASAGSTYTLDADAAAYTYSATAAGLEHDRLIDADAASYAYTASDAGLEYGRQIVADAASYAWTAQDAGLEYDRLIDADSAAYAWTASDATLAYTPVVSSDVTPAPTLQGGAGRFAEAEFEGYKAQRRARMREVEQHEREREKLKEKIAAENRRAASKKRQSQLSERVQRERAGKLARYDRQIAAADAAIVAALAEIRRLETELAARNAMIADRRRRLMLVALAAA